ncbi:Asp-tRNA(Asn)/Glu-tRNA(Gln) amidotransferase subunit GatB [Saccharolobus solfataricus]|uniref:Aspartyl/glutamyl-tRNA(Asn/Gln) amidotransferase subunit B n=1 Tax=Saccharolobus solfataricus TaxID=2287 RepID=A0A0E3K8Q1_SACSO|nr:Asp-tRNA(Asn)/Glu-tRNA(Gln) amidotransferase subunit GatB [Saccharolobus solfataricus]AKA76252.2 Asp-tRNA(Asn)/Glu-tRNA(Gln) amidotransferase subunit GatB [Saccharolobus solfataricus]AKA78944.2 Asp-tRNA(Asn)/Glu-tRNA(Gln) amidotransferase subunit GatB [Saccharolobus solfataricus]AZF68022.1 Asp-tRNA(Asn)/Glu-tRNA(Gln) amidotransferase subunit GatB [Saccharolobus solfataricus]AZF70642.1 Asp-tRNA(Asn)/Glu-tRNA(Gln) amidotransferase subunit GatB [Saccharolobus solfataricus]
MGLEVHVHITALKTKLFCSCPSDYTGKDPNTVTCPVCLGLPGAIPVLNENAVKYGILTALALNCQIAEKLIFDRKHYFYPDMSKNYQISQYDGPGSMAIAKDGYIKLNDKIIRIRRINIEEDPAKIVYPTGSILTSKYTLLDYNRSGTPLLEIVTEPDLRSAKEARFFLEKLRSILEHLGVCDCGIEGAMKADVNISVKGGERVEVKNVGSPKDVEDAINYEIARQRASILQGIKIERETRHWDNERRVTVPLRTKETEEDYRYFPDPDLPPYSITPELIEKFKREMPELPDQRAERFVKQYNVTPYQAQVLVNEKALADLFEEITNNYKNYAKVANLLINDYMRWLNENNITVTQSKAKANHIIELFEYLDSGLISIKIVKELLPEMILTGKTPGQLIKEKGMTNIKDENYLERIIDEVLNEEKEAVEKAKRDPKVVNYLVGMVMKKTGKRADPQMTVEIIKKKLGLT